MAPLRHGHLLHVPVALPRLPMPAHLGTKPASRPSKNDGVVSCTYPLLITGLPSTNQTLLGIYIYKLQIMDIYIYKLRLDMYAYIYTHLAVQLDFSPT